MRTPPPPSYLERVERRRPGITPELGALLACTLYGATIGAAIASALWWWLG